MSSIRKIDLAADYPTLVRWWEGHKATVMPRHIIPQGWIIASGPVELAAAFLMLDVGGKWAVIEFLTTNHSVAFSRYLVEDVRKLIAHIEGVAAKQGCVFIGSFIAPGTGEERLMKAIGYQDVGGPAHKMYGKPLAPEST